MKTLSVAAALLAISCGGPSAPIGPTLPHELADPVLPEARPANVHDDAPRPTPPAPAYEEPKGDPWADRTDLIQTPPLAKPAAVNLPKIERFTLDNGLRVLVVPSHDLPVVTFHLTVLSGDGEDSRDHRGIAAFTAAMLTKGTAKHTADEIAHLVDSVGASLGAGTDLEGTYLNCTALSTALDTCLTLLPEIAVTPVFPEKEMKQVADQLIGNIKALRDDAGALARAHLENAFWGDDHVRGWPHTIEAIQGISQKDLADWHKAHYVAGNAILAVAGDVDPKKLKADLAKAFGDWKHGKIPAEPSYTMVKPKGITVRLVDKPEQNQSQILIGEPGIAHGDADFFAVELMNYTLGGGAFSSRLMKVVRSQGAKTYGARSSVERWRTRGLLAVSTFTRTAETVPTLNLMLGELKKMHDSGPTAEELANAKSNLSGSYPTSFETAGDVAGAVAGAEMHGLTEDYVRQWPLKIDAATLDQVKAAARKHVDPDNMVIVILGKADELKPELDKAGLKYEVVSWQDPISKRDRDAKVNAKNAPVDAAKTAEGKKLLDAALAAKGGEAKLRAVKDIKGLGSIKVNLGGQIAEGEWRNYFMAPDKLRLEVSLSKMNVTVIQVFAPTGAWQSAGTQVVALPPDLAKEALAGLWREHDVILLHHKDAGTVVQTLPKEKIGDVTYDAVMVRKADGSSETKILLDPTTHQVFRLAYLESGSPVFEEYSDYRDVDGLKFAFKQHEEGGKQSFDVVVTEMKANAGVSPDIFVQPK